MDLSIIDYKVYEYVYEAEEGFIEYLKGLNGGSLVRTYCTYMDYAWKAFEKMGEKYDIHLKKSSDSKKYKCWVGDGEKSGYAECELSSMAICLAIIDFFEGKENYLQEAQDILDELERMRKEQEEKIKMIYEEFNKKQ